MEALLFLRIQCFVLRHVGILRYGEPLVTCLLDFDAYGRTSVPARRRTLFLARRGAPVTVAGPLNWLD